MRALPDTHAWPLWPVRASSYAGDVDHLCLFLLGVTTLFSLGFAAALIYFAARYRRTPERQVGDDITGSTPLEVGVISSLLALSLVMFFWGARVYFTLYTPPGRGLQVYAVGRQWMWKFQHQDGEAEINELHVPIDRDIQVTLASEDVIHSFYVPAFRLKMDVIPGRYRTAWFRATRPGRYHLFCAELCGTAHSAMGGSVVAMTPTDYAEWLRTGPFLSAASAGQRLFQSLSCDSCHRADTQGRGPYLRGVPDSEVLLDTGAVVRADDAYLRESILEPRAKIVAGFTPIMPTYQGQLSEEQVLQLIAYLRSLRNEPTP